MRRADRLFQIVQYLRSRRITTADWLAEKIEVSERTIYQDIADLSASGVPLEGEAGIGYVLRHKLDLPPLMFDQPLTTLAVTAIVVFLMVYVVMPRYTRLVQQWLSNKIEFNKAFKAVAAPLDASNRRILRILRAAYNRPLALR